MPALLNKLKTVLRQVFGFNQQKVDEKPKPPINQAIFDSIHIVDQSGPKHRYDCGHYGPDSFTIEVFGERTTPRKSCPNCVREMVARYAVRCARCGKLVYPGGGVVLYHKLSVDLPYLATATHVKPSSVVGCTRYDCGAEAALFAGNWSEEGFVPFRFNSRPVEGELRMPTTAI